jgi:hypothetical protein
MSLNSLTLSKYLYLLSDAPWRTHKQVDMKDEARVLKWWMLGARKGIAKLWQNLKKYLKQNKHGDLEEINYNFTYVIS